jgi:RHS repeat-associated protein
MTKLISLCTFFAVLASAQTAPLETKPQRGFLPSAVYSLSELDSINTVNGNLSLRIPLASLPPGRAGHSFDVELLYHSQIYDISIGRRMSPSSNEVLTQELTNGKTGGWHYNFSNIGVDFEIRQTLSGGWNCTTDGLPAMRLYRLRIGLADGSQHVLHLRGYGDELGDGYNGDGYYAIGPDGRRTICATFSSHYPADLTGRLTYYTSDGTFLKLEIDADGSSPWWQKQWTLYFPDGRRITGYSDRADAIYDANGNRIDIQQLCRDPECNSPYTQISDAFGRAVTIDYNASDPNNSSQDVATAAGFSGNATWTIQWTSILIGGSSVIGGDDRTYECGPESTYCPLAIGHRVVSRIDVPSTPALFYQFDYSTNADAGYGELDYMKTPYGAEITYRYFQENLFKTLATLLKNPVKSKTVTHDGQTDPAWQYQFNQGQSTITNPDGGVVTTYFYDPDILSDWRRGLVYKVVQPEGDVLERVWEQNKTWGLRSTSLADPNNPFVKKELSSVASNGVPVKTAIIEFDQDKNGNLLERREYDWAPYGTTSGSVVRRRTTQTYYVTLPASGTLSDDASAYWRPHNASFWPDSLSGRRLNAVLRREIKDGSTVQAASEFEYDDAYRKGNLTKDKQWDSTKSAVLPGPGQFSTANAVILTRSYDSFGNLTEVFEPEVRTTLTYGTVCGAPSLYPTQIQQAPGLAEQRTTIYSWHCGTGLLASQTDLENGFTIAYLYDRLGRRTEANEGNLRASTTAYDDGSRKVTAKADLRAFRAGELQTVTHYDQLGRVRLVRRSDGAPLSDTSETDGIKVQTVRRVASGGNIEIVSNPYRTGAESTMGWTCTQQDRNGRVRWVGSFAGAVAPNSCLDLANRTGLAETRYQGDVTVSIDPANKQRDLARDALGRLVTVAEYTGGTPATYLTTYAYNALDNLMVVQQGSQSRSFVYSSLGRLISAYNPESGGVSYTYFDHGGLYTRTDARSVTTTHSYDGLHRLRTKSYTDSTPGVTNEYYLAGNAPQVGRLKSVTSSVASTMYIYDALGRVTASSQTVAGSPHSYDFLYTWLLNDGLATMRYPSGRTVTYAQDDAGRVVQVQDGAKLYAQGIGYTAHGAITQMQLGNGLVEQWLYNSRLQPTSIRLGDVAGSDSAFGAALDYGATNNNGNLLSQRITGMGLDRTQTYQYDGVNRLIGSGELAVWSRNFAYDQQGNGWVSSASGLSTSSFTPVTSNWFNAQNRLTGMGATYDGAGNQTGIGGLAFSYDAENRLKTSTINNYTTTYVYDGEGRRVKKLLASGEQTLFIYDAMGQLAAEYTTGQFAHSGTRYLTVDHLGSIRAVTSQEKTVLARRDYLPFGEEIPPPLGGRTSVWAADAGLLQKFTGKERDAETGLDYLGARYFPAVQGRFNSPDPLLNSGRPWEPRSWNRYAYVLNNPLRYTDPAGMYEWDKNCGTDDKICQENREKFREALARLRQVAQQYKEGSAERGQIDAVLAKIGTEGDRNNIRIAFDPKLKAFGDTRPTLGGNIRITLNFDRLDSSLSAWAAVGHKMDVSRAALVAHEGRHATESFRSGLKWVLSGQERLNFERRATDVESLVFKGLNQQDPFGLWNPSWAAADAARAEELRRQAVEESVQRLYNPRGRQ